MDDFEISFDPPPPPAHTPPPEDLSFPPVAQGTVFYLTVANPKADTWTWRGPFASFAPVVGVVEGILAASNSTLTSKANPKSASKGKGKGKKKATLPAWHSGFSTLVAIGSKPSREGNEEDEDWDEEDEDETEKDFSILHVIREINPDVYEALQEAKPCWTVVKTGPLRHEVDVYTRDVTREGGRATTSTLLPTHTSAASALAAARTAMAELLSEETATTRPGAKEAFPEGQAGAGLIMAISATARYEVRVFFETDGLVPALGGGKGRPSLG